MSVISIDQNFKKINYEFKMYFFHFYVLNIDISVTICVIGLKFSVCALKVLFEGKVSQNFDLGPSFDFM